MVGFIFVCWATWGDVTLSMVSCWAYIVEVSLENRPVREAQIYGCSCTMAQAEVDTCVYQSLTWVGNLTASSINHTALYPAYSLYKPRVTSEQQREDRAVLQPRGSRDKGQSDRAHYCAVSDTLACNEHQAFLLNQDKLHSISVITDSLSADGRANTASKNDLEAVTDDCLTV